MSEEAASHAVLGAAAEAIGTAVTRHWGLDDSVLHMVRRLPLDAPVHSPDDDDDMLRLVASAANEAVDALALPQAQVMAAMQRVVQRYGRPLAITLKDLHAALLETPATGATPAATPPRTSVPLPPGGLRAAAAPSAVREP
jgi:non-specific serine/threonine protein kinase